MAFSYACGGSTEHTTVGQTCLAGSQSSKLSRVPVACNATPVEGVVAAAREVSLSVPLCVRLAGTNVELGKRILEESGLPIIAADDLADAAEKAVMAAREAA